MRNVKQMLVLCLSLFFMQVAFAEQDPVALLKSVADNMIAGLKANQATLKTKPSIVYQLSYQYVVPHAAIGEMAKRVIPPQIWNQASAKEREQFQKAFTTTLIRTYASALSAYHDQSIHFYPVRGGYSGAQTISVNSEIVGTSGHAIQVTYQLIRANNQWKLYDLSVEGVDMLESFRAQFADILANGSLSQLLDRLAVHNQHS